MSNLSFVSSNEGKIKEAQKILGFPIDIVKLELDEIQSLNLNNIVIKKAEEAYKKLNKPLLVDDVGLYLNGWSGFPGPFIKFLISKSGNDLLLQMLSSFTDKSAVLKSAIGYHNGKEIMVFIGEVEGDIVESRGKGGWGFDSIFVPKGYDKTFAQMTEKEKNKISHRFQALVKLKEYLTIT